MTDLFSKANALLVVTFLLASFFVFIGVEFINSLKSGISFFWQMVQGAILVAFISLIVMYFQLYLNEKKFN